MIDLNALWFFLLTFLFIGYAVLDGFDLGVGVLHLFTRDEGQRRLLASGIGPVWDGNEVWLLTAGGALFAAFPRAYATVFSAFYMPIMLLLTGLIFRAVSLEFRNKVDSPGWKKTWDLAFGLGSLLVALLLGVAFGNLLRGIPLNSAGRFTGSFLGLLNPFSLLVGCISLCLFTMHGALFMSMKSDGALRDRLRTWIHVSWIITIILYAFFYISSFFAAPHILEGCFSSFIYWVLFILLLASLVYVPIACKQERYAHAFTASSCMVLSMIGLAAVGLFPALAVSSLDYANSLTIYNACSTPRTHGVMLVITLIGMPLVIGYTIYVYRVFKGKVVLEDEEY
ncbi:cytochrome d ubiquinol oxidase subunit II [Fibrobacterota bacterium]